MAVFGSLTCGTRAAWYTSLGIGWRVGSPFIVYEERLVSLWVVQLKQPVQPYVVTLGRATLSPRVPMYGTYDLPRTFPR